MLKIALAQINPIVGDLKYNRKKIIEFSNNAYQKNTDVVIFPELTVCGYPPEDLLLQNGFVEECEKSVVQIIKSLPKEIIVIIGSVKSENTKIFNIALVIKNKQVIAEYKKQNLPNYEVFDELRHFSRGSENIIFNINEKVCAVTICEDLWNKKITKDLKKLKVDYIFNLNASPYHINKSQIRKQTMQKITNGFNLVYVNQVGGQDELVFDGGSFVMNEKSEEILTLSYFKEELKILANKNNLCAKISQTEKIYQAIVLATKDYVQKNNFSKVVLGLSGGIDSALTLCVAVDALGAKNVEAIMMPSRFNLDISLKYANQQAQILNVKHKIISIEPMFESFLQNLDFIDTSNLVVENIQARIRGVILMARSNQNSAMLLTTGNKSELAVGYATLYGDMAGGFAPLKDIYKTQVYQIAKWLNKDKEVIPENVIKREPSAELSQDQKDSDSLPDYKILDAILYQYIENSQSKQQIIKKGFDANLVAKILKLVNTNEYKRNQSPPGVKISQRNFGKDRRFPITKKIDF